MPGWKWCVVAVAIASVASWLRCALVFSCVMTPDAINASVALRLTESCANLNRSNVTKPPKYCTPAWSYTDPCKTVKNCPNQWYGPLDIGLTESAYLGPEFHLSGPLPQPESTSLESSEDSRYICWPSYSIYWGSSLLSSPALQMSSPQTEQSIPTQRPASTTTMQEQESLLQPPPERRPACVMPGGLTSIVKTLLERSCAFAANVKPLPSLPVYCFSNFSYRDPCWVYEPCLTAVKSVNLGRIWFTLQPVTWFQQRNPMNTSNFSLDPFSTTQLPACVPPDQVV